MATTIKNKTYTYEELLKRYSDWSKLPAIEPQHFRARIIAWHQYCDARDSVVEGTSARLYLESELQRPHNPSQFEMFTKRFQS